MSEEFDVVVVGSGAGGMATAVTAASLGLKALLVEKAPTFGGSTARSGGGVWVPGNEVLKAAGIDHDPAPAARYLEHIVGDDAPAPMVRAFLRHGPAALSLLLRNTPMKLTWVKGYSDYYPEAPGGRPDGRSTEPVPLSSRLLGADHALLNPPYMKARGNLPIMQGDYKWLNLIARHPRGTVAALKVAGRAARARLRREELLTMGQGLAAGMWLAVRNLGVPVWLSTPLVGLAQEDDGIAVTVHRDGQDVVLRPRLGVVLAAGGFERDPALREEFSPKPTSTEWTVGAKENTGDAIRLGRGLDAGVTLMDDAWWGPSIVLPRGPVFLLAERSLPGCMLVNAAGERFANEAAPYVDAVHRMYEAHTEETPAVPAWLVFDQRYRDRYLFAGIGPRQGFPGKWYRSGAVVKADTLEKLAAEIGVPSENLAATAARLNTFADAGRDDDFHKGDSAYDRYYGDPRNRPNPCLGRIDRAPFYAFRIVPGDLGTKGGLTTDERARVLRPDGSAIPGLYAVGNTSALVMGRTYAGPGATLGPAITFGYIAAHHLAGAPLP